jgi:hypothetical protein
MLQSVMACLPFGRDRGGSLAAAVGVESIPTRLRGFWTGARDWFVEAGGRMGRRAGTVNLKGARPFDNRTLSEGVI